MSACRSLRLRLVLFQRRELSPMLAGNTPVPEVQGQGKLCDSYEDAFVRYSTALASREKEPGPEREENWHSLRRPRISTTR